MAQRLAALMTALFLGGLLGRISGGLESRAKLQEYPSEPVDDVYRRVSSAGAAAVATGRRVVLVTGAAGFVGFHTAFRLHEEGDLVLGLDNFNSYYDVQLKRRRAQLLRRAGMSTLFEGDVCDGELLELLLRSGRVTHVIHLAAQAGVRYSLKKPLAYVEANVKCFVTLLEAVHAVNGSVPIAYASSSSVYGINKRVPFSETHRVDEQVSLYGATKKADENIAHVYHHLHGLRLTGLRFFTVYGPLGRPDMAYFGFTNAILQRKQITEFRNADGECPRERVARRSVSRGGACRAAERPTECPLTCGPRAQARSSSATSPTSPTLWRASWRRRGWARRSRSSTWGTRIRSASRR